MVGKRSLVAAIAGAVLLAGAAGRLGAQLPPEELVTVKLPPAGPHRVYVVDPVFPHLIAGQVFVVDGDTQEVVGKINAGYLSNLILAPGHRELYVAETYYSRGTRGERTDIVTIYDPQELAPTAEVIIPPERFLTVTKANVADITPDGRYLLAVNMTPAISVSVVDIQARKFVGKIETPGCNLVFPSGPTRFAMVCFEGSLLTVTFDAQGRATRAQSPPFFKPDEDPVFEHSPFSKSRGRVLFISYEGMAYPVDLSADAPRVEPAWSLLTDADRAAQWRPGGWQVGALHEATGRLYVLVHQGGKWTHKQPGTEVRVYDVAQRKQVDRLRLVEQANSVAVSQDAEPQLYVLSELGSMQIYDARSGRFLGKVGELGQSPLVLVVGQ